MIRTEGLSKTFGGNKKLPAIHAVEDLNLDIQQGTGVTAINTINGSPSAGSANSLLPDERRNIQFALKYTF